MQYPPDSSHITLVVKTLLSLTCMLVAEFLVEHKVILYETDHTPTLWSVVNDTRQQIIFIRAIMSCSSYWNVHRVLVMGDWPKCTIPTLNCHILTQGNWPPSRSHQYQTVPPRVCAGSRNEPEHTDERAKSSHNAVRGRSDAYSYGSTKTTETLAYINTTSSPGQ